jgi:hypothetical protein
MRQRKASGFVWLAAAAISAFPIPTRAADYTDVIRATPGLIAYYPFEDAGPTISDEAGHGNTPRISAASVSLIDSANPRLGQALPLKEGSHLRVPALGRHSAVTVEMWARLRQHPREGLAGIYAGDGWEGGYLHFNLLSDGGAEIAVNGAGANPRSDPDAFPLNKWVHIAATYDSQTGERKLYSNGRLVLDAAGSPSPELDLVAGSIGTWINGQPTRPLDADIDEVAIYSVALSPTDVRRHYATAKGVSDTPVDFATQVRPLLEKRCFECHGPEKQESELRLDVRDWAMRGGESGEPAIAPFASDESHLLQLVSSGDIEQRMPPEGDPLSADEIATLKNWIDQGAAWPDEWAGHAEQEHVVTSHWSFQPIRNPEPPASNEPFVATGNAVDAFVHAKLAGKGLAPSARADRRTLIRRLYLDVIGLPPTPEEVQAFEQDVSPDAWKALVDRVLASPHYGERWASYWLDVIRYGDTHGFEVNTPRPNAWPYRDYVIKSLNDDKPYDQFVREQIAGDQLNADVATGFLVAAPAVLPGQVGQDLASKRQARADELHEVIVRVSSGVMGLTVGCARCHNHKFDPISQRDYYQLQAVFAGLNYGDKPVQNPAPALLKEGGAPPATSFSGIFAGTPAAYRLYRGDAMQRRERVTPGIPAVFGDLQLESSTPEPQRRKALADWLADPTNPLTARVIVNRIWQHHFGEGFVSTPSDFGAMGREPSHPELLDHLATALMQNGWSLKSLHRLILMSNTYQQANHPREDALAVDSNCRLLWRYPPWRLEMEAIRDSILSVTGSLDLTMGGPGFMVFKPNDNYVRVYDPKETWGPAEWRRMIYAHRVRMAQDGVFGAFDCPDAGQPAPKRQRSITAIQALNLLNSPFIQQQAEILATRAKKEVGEDQPAQIDRVFELTYGRKATDDERAATLEVAKEFGLPAVCRAVLNSSEFLFVP